MRHHTHNTLVTVSVAKEPFGAFWSFLELFGAFWSFLELLELLVTFGAFWVIDWWSCFPSLDFVSP
jgi:hypothetical protein